MEYKLLAEEIFYDGTQLCSHFAYNTCGMQGDSIVAFIGGARVEGVSLVDLEDRRLGRYIFSPLMLHFIIEHFQSSLELGIAHQWLFTGIAFEELNSILQKPGITRTGNDLYFEQRKMSVSIATISPVSTLIHAGFNIATEGTPVPTSGLVEMGIDPKLFSEAVMKRYVDETERMKRARLKIRGVP